MTSLFDDFVNQYSLSKTLRFELKPVGRTKDMLEEDKIFKKDHIIQRKYEQTKPYFDRLHREFVKEALKDAHLSNLNGYLEVFKVWKNDKKKYEKDLEKKEKDLRKEIIKFFNAQAEEWSKKYTGLKNKDLKILDEKDVFQALLKERYGNEPDAFVQDDEGNFVYDDEGNKISIFDSWKDFTGYFTKFFETRRNFYKDDGTSTALATRIIDQNLKRFCDNVIIYEQIKDKIDFSLVEESFGKNMDDVFSLDFYNQCLLQDGIDFYNRVLGGDVLENGEKRQGINELINKYRQDHKGEKLPFLKLLDKQILSEKEKQAFVDEIENDQELQKTLSTFLETAEKKVPIIKDLFSDFVCNNEKYNLENIYISKQALNTITHKWTGLTDVFEEKLFEVINQKDIRELYNALRKEKNDPKIKKEKGSYTFPDFIRLSHIRSALENIENDKFWKERYYENEDDALSRGFLVLTTKENVWNQFLDIFQFEFMSLFENEIRRNREEDEDFEKILHSVRETEEIVSFDENKRIIESKIGYDIFDEKMNALLEDFSLTQDSKVIIKNFADSVLRIYQMAKYFAVEKKRKWLDDYDLDDFYTNPNFGFELFYDHAYEDIVQVYNKLRNYLTRKPYSEEKWKLNFDNSTLADGWDKNKESDNYAVLLRKEGKYFLGIMKKGHNKVFDDRNGDKFQQNIENGKYEKVVYKLLPGANKMLPKVFFSASNIDFYAPNEKVLEIRNYATHSKNGTPQKGFEKRDFEKGDCHILIDFFKDSITKHPDWNNFNFQFSQTNTYENISDFYREVEAGGYKISFQDISDDYIQEKNENGELYLFQIHNKDWNEGSMGKKNLHTLYFESLFSEENMAHNFPMKLNGQAEIFYRPKTEKEKLGTKKDKQGKEVVNHKRYNENKIFFHVPMTMNRTKSDAGRFNAEINNFLANNPDINIIGVDRGEKHLAYYSVINQKGDILESDTLNTVLGTNYSEKLEEKAENREQARKDWQEVEGIKDLKKGYISQVVRKLADLGIKHNAIIVFEDLNMRFKQIRGGIEKSVYQQLEKALIEKLSFLVDKGEKDPKQAGHLLKAYQLSAPFETFQKMGKQTGILFYTQAAYTSRIDPITGWRPHLYLKYASAEQAKKEILQFSKIEFTNGRFECTYDIRNFRQQKEYPQSTVWTVCSNVERFRWNRNLHQNKGGYDHYQNVTENLKTLFEDFGIDIDQNIIGQIEILETKGNEKFFKDFIFFFNLICQIRNTDENAMGLDQQDFILSPVQPFFDSRKENGNNLPKNGDDNGAYNIARKGIIILGKISKYANENGSCEDMKWGDLYVSNVEWDDFVSLKK